MTLILLSVTLGLGALALLLTFVSSEKGRRNLALALRSLWLHKLRSFLSVLGIIIGTGAVIALMAFGKGSMQDALEDIARMGATNVIVRSEKPPEDSSSQQRRVAIYGLTWGDYERFDTISTVTRRVPMRIFPQQIRYLDRMITGRMVATTPEYADVNQLQLASGRFLVEDDDRHMLNVAVLGATTADRLFPFEDPIDQTVRLGSYFYRVVGVIRERVPTGGSGGSQAAEDFNSDIYIPLQTCKARYGERIVLRQSGSWSGEQVELSQVTLTVTDMDRVRPTGEVVKELLDRYHDKTDYKITVPLDRLEEAERARDRYTGLLAIIAGISLLVGGIGIMNIMLATVTERTREIGIRRALGAKRRDIISQFLIEAVVQTTTGGMIGVLLGLGVVLVLPPVVGVLANWGWLQGHLPAVIDVYSIFISVGVSVAVGVGFGLYPAWKASRLDPIEALRHE
jgi:putative ABC transport system permease protein